MDFTDRQQSAALARAREDSLLGSCRRFPPDLGFVSQIYFGEFAGPLVRYFFLSLASPLSVFGLGGRAQDSGLVKPVCASS